MVSSAAGIRIWYSRKSICRLHRSRRKRTSKRRFIIGYLKFYVGISPYYYIAAAVMFVGVLLIARRLPLMRGFGLSLLLPYLFMVIVATLVLRTPSEDCKIMLIPFQTFEEALTNDFWEFEIQANILLFIPVGLFLSMTLDRSKYLPIVIGVSISFAIEVTQLITHRGTFEIDDIITNFFGVLIGYIIFAPFRMVGELYHPKEKRE